VKNNAYKQMLGQLASRPQNDLKPISESTWDWPTTGHGLVNWPVEPEPREKITHRSREPATFDFFSTAHLIAVQRIYTPVESPPAREQ
jgi:hypothetical protein